MISRAGREPELIAQRYMERDGARLIQYREVGLPFYRINVQALTLEHKPLDAFSEFLLRSVSLGTSTSEDAARLLGIERAVMDPVVASLVASNDVAPAADIGRSTTVLELTSKGALTLQQLGTIQPTETWIDIDYDALLRKPVEPHRDLTEPDVLRTAGASLLKPTVAKAPESEDLDHRSIERMIQELGGGAARAKRTLLGFKPIERRKRRTMFLPAVMLIYRTADLSSVRIEFAINGQLSEEHAHAFARTKQHNRIQREILGGPTLEESIKGLLPLRAIELAKSHDTHTLQQTIAVASLLEAEGSPDELAANAAKGAREQLERERIRFMETFEHRAVLADALETARQRLLIIAPWIRRGVVDAPFLSKLGARLAAGVRVYIGWGISDQPELDADDSALKPLEALAAQHPTTFTLKRLGDTHSKVLICDDRFVVVGSFNWLSFRGDPDRTYRDERGILIRAPKSIEQAFQIEVKRFESPQPAEVSRHSPRLDARKN